MIVAGSGLDPAKVFWAYEGKPRPTAPYIEMTLDQVKGVGHDWTTTEDNPFAFGTLTVASVDASTNALAIANHGLSNGDGPVQLAATTTLPAPLLAATNYWVIYVDAGHFKLATTFEHTGGQMPLGVGNPITPIDLTTVGSGSITVSSTADTLAAGKEIVRRAEGFREVTIHLDCYCVEGQGYAAMRMLTNVISEIQLYIWELDNAGVGVSDLGGGFSQGGVRHLEGRRGSVLEPRSMCDITAYMASSVVRYATIVSTIDGEIRMQTPGDVDLPAIPVHITLE